MTDSDIILFLAIPLGILLGIGLLWFLTAITKRHD